MITIKFRSNTANFPYEIKVNFKSSLDVPLANLRLCLSGAFNISNVFYSHVQDKHNFYKQKNKTNVSEMKTGLETEIGRLSFDVEARGDISWIGLEAVSLDYMITNRPTSQCHVFTEPHVITFDQNRFDFYGTGTFLLHKNEIDDFEVTLKTF